MLQRWFKSKFSATNVTFKFRRIVRRVHRTFMSYNSTFIRKIFKTNVASARKHKFTEICDKSCIKIITENNWDLRVAYSAGSFYLRHKISFHNKLSSLVSCVVSCNAFVQHVLFQKALHINRISFQSIY